MNKFRIELAKKFPFLKKLLIKKIYKHTLKSTKLKCSEIYDRYTKDLKINNEEKRTIKYDMVYTKKVYGLSFSEYFMFGIRNKSHKERKSFLNDKERLDYLRLLGNHTGYKILSDKYETYKYLKKYFKRDVILVNSNENYEEFKRYVEKHPTFVKKPTKASLGHGVGLVNINNNKELNDYFKEFVDNGPTIIEEKIEQDSKMASFHPKSLNTIRLVTYLDDENNVHIHCPFIKIGQGDSFVDNGGAGGILASIDPITGVITSDGKDELARVYKKHPDSRITIKGFQIPKWEEAIKFANNLAKDFPDTRYVGWDVALSKTSWVLVEGNSRTQFVGQQMPLEKGIKKDLENLIDYKKLLKEKNKQNSNII